MKTQSIYKIILLLLLAIYSTSLSAQIGPIQNTVIPPSPTSAVFREFAGYTPNLATGAINVPIDLYEVNVGKFTIPISLQYYTSGIKITDNPYPAGYGWILSPGLRITRTIMGRPDMVYPMDVRQSANDFEYFKKAMYDPYRSNHSGWWSGMLHDTQHDVFTVHLPHGNYTFFVEKSGSEYVAVTTNNLLKITPVSIASFEITDENGVIYYFGQGDHSSPLAYAEHYNEYYTSWMIRKIVLPGSNHEINFMWEPVRHSTLSFGNFFGGDVVKDYKERVLGVSEDINPNYTSAEQIGLLTGHGEYTEVLHLKQISFPAGTVNYTYRAADNPLVTGITVKNKNNVTVKSIGFTYGTGLDERLLLSINQSDQGVYQFQYHSKRFNAGSKHDQDYWGYYNEKRNVSLVPRMQIKTYNNRINPDSYSYVYYGTADRNINADAMKAYMLTKVVYPTGGYSAFEYEPHRFQGSAPTTNGLGETSKQPLTQGGGLRITKVTTSAVGEAPVIVKTYKYGTNENGLANVIYEPAMDTFIDECNAYEAEAVNDDTKIGYNIRALFLNTQSNYMRYAINTPALWYSTVTEYINDESKSVYSFNRHIPENALYTTIVKDFATKSIARYSNLFSKGCLLTKEVQYLKSGGSYTPLKETNYTYAMRQGRFENINNLFVNRNCVSLLNNGPDFEIRNNYYIDGQYVMYGSFPIREYFSNNYTIEFAYEELTGRQTIHYSPNGNGSEQVDYTYSNLQLRSTTTTLSNGHTQTEQYLYPMDHAQAETQEQKAILLTMYNKNIRSVPFKVTKTVNSNTEQTKTEFRDFGNNLYLPGKTYYKKGDHAEVCKNTYAYDIRGNLSSITQNSAFKNTYLWGYDYSCPVAVIEGLDYAETLAMVGQQNIDNLSNRIYVSSTLNSIRNLLDARAMVTTYTYEPLIGMTSVTVPNGQTTYYSYDPIGRLKQVEDKNRKKLQRFAYHRAGETMSLTFTTAASYNYGTNAKVTATTSGGSEWYNYVWTLKNSGGTVLYTSTTSESATASIPLQQTGSMTLTCTVTDRMTSEVQTCSRTFTVSRPVIEFSNIYRSGNNVFATIACSGTCTVSFYINAEMNGGTADFYLAGQRYALEWANGQTVNVTLSGGSHNFSISLANSPGGERAGIYITGVSSSHSTGSPSYIEAYN